jgi:hypothetical protein
MMRFNVLVLTSLCLLVPSLARSGADLAYTDPAHTDEDFVFQGEYRGGQRSLPSQRSVEPVGLQVIARGNGRFDAVKYYAGLPGERRFRPERFPLRGERVGQVVMLIGDPQVNCTKCGEPVLRWGPRLQPVPLCCLMAAIPESSAIQG